MNTNRETVYCAFCKNPKYIRTQKHIGWTNVLLCLLASLTSMFILWQSFEPRFLILLTIYIALSEMFVYLSWRMSVRCDTCAFDPVLYRSNPVKASEIVKAHLEELKLSGRHLLKRNNPFSHLPSQKKPEQASALPKKPVASTKPESQILSRQI